MRLFHEDDDHNDDNYFEDICDIPDCVRPWVVVVLLHDERAQNDDDDDADHHQWVNCSMRMSVRELRVPP